MWSLILKSLLQETRWCNRILIRIFGLSVMIFFLLQKVWKLLMSAFLSWLAAALAYVSKPPKAQGGGGRYLPPGSVPRGPVFSSGKKDMADCNVLVW